MTGPPAGTVTRLILDFAPHSRPINGWLSDGEQRWQFSGWVEFAAALQAALELRRNHPHVRACTDSRPVPPGSRSRQTD